MINELTTSPKPQNKSARNVCLGCFAAFIAVAVLYTYVDKYKGIVGLVAIGILTAGIFIYTKYISSKYYYDITYDSDGTPILVIRQLMGRRYTTLLRTSLSEIREVVRESREESAKKKVDSRTAIYRYAPTLIPDFTYRLTVKNYHEQYDVIIEGNDEFADLLRSYSEEARARENSKNDEY